MIYTVICNKEWDCSPMLQSHISLPDSVRKIIDNTKNESVRTERIKAYSLLSLALNEFYALKEWNLKKDEHGKPYLVDYTSDKIIHISLSHSDGVAAVSLSDEGMIGVDLQAEIDPLTEERLSKRFFLDADIVPSRLDVRYFLANRDKLKEITLLDTDWKLSFTDKWSACESVIKCDGRGFELASSLSKKLDGFLTEIKILPTDKNNYSISNSIKKPL